MTQSLKLALADTQGKLFEMSHEKGFGSESFIKAFMLSEIASDLHWAGKEYIMERITDELKDKIASEGEVFDRERLYWIGYVYRFWHYDTGENSKEIYKQAPAETMRITYLSYHTLSVEMAIDRLKESYAEKHKKISQTSNIVENEGKKQ